MLAYACDPYRGSEPGTGWHRAFEVAKHFDTWVLCERDEFKASIERFLAENGPIPGLKFCLVPKTRFERHLGAIPGLYYPSYKLWHRKAFRVASTLHADLKFDIVHQANMCGFREPGYLWRLDAPFVWGPIGGSQNYPWRFLARAGFRGAVREAVRTLLNQAQLRYSPRVKAAARKAALMMAANTTNVRDFQRVHGVAPVLLLEIGIESVAAPRRPERHEGLHILWSGEFSHRKALHLLISALAGLPPSITYELRILGKGPLAGSWRRLARRTGVEAHCRWLGWLPRAEAWAHYEWADLFAFTSLRDTAGTVVLEALSRGVPVVCLDHQGAGDIITPDCGVKIPVAWPKQTIGRLRDAIAELARDRERLAVLSRGALERAETFLWSRQGERLAELYHQVLEAKAESSWASASVVTPAMPAAAELETAAR